MPNKTSKKRRTVSKPAKSVKKECCTDNGCCSCGLNLSFWPIALIVVGIVWLVEYYAAIDVPLVAIVILLVGLFMLFKKDKK